MSETPKPFPERLREPRFRHGSARTVDYSPGFSDRRQSVATGSEEEADLTTLIRILGEGQIVPDRFYRALIDANADELLETYGIKHVHLGGRTSDVILFLVEYADKILLLEIDDHRHFATKPVGSILNGLHRSTMTAADKAAEGRGKAAAAKRKMEVTSGLLERRKR